MKYFALITIFVCSLVVWSCDPVDAAPFSVDKRSAMHVGASALISSTCGVILFNAAPEESGPRRTFCFLSALGVGVVKEFVLDAYPDYGDLAFDVIGSLSVIATDTWQLKAYRKGEANGLEITFNY